jgi:hypothetical protein
VLMPMAGLTPVPRPLPTPALPSLAVLEAAGNPPLLQLASAPKPASVATAIAALAILTGQRRNSDNRDINGACGLVISGAPASDPGRTRYRDFGPPDR